jgi:hypothetical protein
MIRDTAFWGESVTDSRPRQAHQPAGKGWGKGGLSYLAERGVLSCCVGFFTRPVLSHPIRLNLPLSGAEAWVYQMLGEEWLEITETSFPDVSLAVLIGKSYDFAVYRVARRSFWGGTRVETRSAFAKSEVDALFRIEFPNRKVEKDKL